MPLLTNWTRVTGLLRGWSIVRCVWFMCALTLVLSTPGIGMAQGSDDWSGRWNSYWREGAALLVLEQKGAAVTGTYEPGGGRIDAQVDGQVLRGQWTVDGVSGSLLFALADDGQTFTGRFDTGEFWNGQRSTANGSGARLIANDTSPRDTLKAIVSALNDFLIGGDVDALRFAQTLLVFDGEAGDSRAQNRRRALLWNILDLSTFRIYDAPPRPEGDTARFRIVLDGTDAAYDLRFVQSTDGRWRVLVEDEATLSAALEQYLEALGVPSVAAAKSAALQSPRGVVQRFLFGIHDWDGTGREAVLSTLDLTALPDYLHEAEGPLLADYLKNVIDRAGFVFFQEIPNNWSRSTPYVYYTHPLGDIVISRQASGAAESPARWTFDAETLRNLPTLYSSMQHLPLSDGVTATAPLTDFFLIRARVHASAPRLLHRAIVLENWQWLAMLGLLVATFLLYLLLGVLRPRRSTPDDANELMRTTSGQRPFVQAARLTLCSLVLATGFGTIGLIETRLAVLHTGASVLTVVGATWFVILTISAVGAFFQRKASSTPGYVDEIVTAMAIGLAKLAVLAGGVLLLAEIVNLPYEGALAGLGVGGLALAFAARDTVSNILGGVLLLTDRPFRRGDLVETHGELATVEGVGIRSTRLKRLDDTVMIIPNAQLSDRVIVNWGLRARRRVDLSIGLTFDTPRDRLEQFLHDLRDLVARQPQVDTSEVYVGLKDFGSSAIEFECRCFFRVFTYDEQVAARSALISDIIDLADRVGVHFAFPTRTIHMAPPAV